MNAHTEVDQGQLARRRSTTANARPKDLVKRAGSDSTPAPADETDGHGEDRVSVDPLRATDRYRLVLPLALPQ